MPHFNHSPSLALATIKQRPNTDRCGSDGEMPSVHPLAQHIPAPLLWPANIYISAFFAAQTALLSSHLYVDELKKLHHASAVFALDYALHDLGSSESTGSSVVRSQTPVDNASLDWLRDPMPSSVVGGECDADSVYRILKSLTSEHEKCVRHAAWTHLPEMVHDVTSVDMNPSSEFLALVKSVNLDFFFGELSTFDELGGKILSWLNGLYPLPREVIELWEDYAYMSFFHAVVNDFDFDEELDDDVDLDFYREILLRNPELIRLLRMSMVLPALTPLYQFRVLLGASWDELRSIICSLRPIFSRDETVLAQLWKPLRDPNFAKVYPFSDVFCDLAVRSIRVTRDVYRGAAPEELIGFWLEWGRYVRSSPHSPELLWELRSFIPQDDTERGMALGSEVYDVLKWLESFPGAPQEEVMRWAEYLPRGTATEREYAYDARWTGWSGLGWCIGGM